MVESHDTWKLAPKTRRELLSEYAVQGPGLTLFFLVLGLAEIFLPWPDDGTWSAVIALSFAGLFGLAYWNNFRIAWNEDWFRYRYSFNEKGVIQHRSTGETRCLPWSEMTVRVQKCCSLLYGEVGGQREAFPVDYLDSESELARRVLAGLNTWKAPGAGDEALKGLLAARREAELSPLKTPRWRWHAYGPGTWLVICALLYFFPESTLRGNAPAVLSVFAGLTLLTATGVEVLIRLAEFRARKLDARIDQIDSG